MKRGFGNGPPYKAWPNYPSVALHIGPHVWSLPHSCDPLVGYVTMIFVVNHINLSARDSNMNLSLFFMGKVQAGLRAAAVRRGRWWLFVLLRLWLSIGTMS